MYICVLKHISLPFLRFAVAWIDGVTVKRSGSVISHVSESANTEVDVSLKTPLLHKMQILFWTDKNQFSCSTRLNSQHECTRNKQMQHLTCISLCIIFTVCLQNFHEGLSIQKGHFTIYQWITLFWGVCALACTEVDYCLPFCLGNKTHSRTCKTHPKIWPDSPVLRPY